MPKITVTVKNPGSASTNTSFKPAHGMHLYSQGVLGNGKQVISFEHAGGAIKLVDNGGGNFTLEIG